MVGDEYNLVIVVVVVVRLSGKPAVVPKEPGDVDNREERELMW